MKQKKNLHQLFLKSVSASGLGGKHYFAAFTLKKVFFLWVFLPVQIRQSSARALYYVNTRSDEWTVISKLFKTASSLEKTFETFLYISHYEYLLITLRDLTT